MVLPAARWFASQDTASGLTVLMETAVVTDWLFEEAVSATFSSCSATAAFTLNAAEVSPSGM
jgi:hypothetical protein